MDPEKSINLFRTGKESYLIIYYIFLKLLYFFLIQKMSYQLSGLILIGCLRRGFVYVG